MHSVKVLVIGLMWAMLMGCQVKSEKEPLVQLSATEVNALFMGKTVESFNLISGITSFSFYTPDGRVLQERYWEQRTGRWRVNEKAEMCMSMEGTAYRCRTIYRKGQKYYKYRLDQDGKPQKIIRYRQFIEGNALK
tara:strand:- start:675 stop:1082 length:408 start_codon:yes stop_codon:yes gene_type:complete